MTVGRTLALTAALVGAWAVGVWTGPLLFERNATETMTPVSATDTAPDAEPALSEVPVTSAELQERLKPLLNPGARISAVAEGFDDAVQGATVVHAAHNTGIPLMLLKHRILEERRSLEDAIRESRPDIHVAIEADRARAEAQSVVASVAG